MICVSWKVPEGFCQNAHQDRWQDGQALCALHFDDAFLDAGWLDIGQILSNWEASTGVLWHVWIYCCYPGRRWKPGVQGLSIGGEQVAVGTSCQGRQVAPGVTGKLDCQVSGQVR